MSTTASELAASVCETVDDYGNIDHDARKQWLSSLQSAMDAASESDKKDAISTVISQYRTFRRDNLLADEADQNGTTWLMVSMKSRLHVAYP